MGAQCGTNRQTREGCHQAHDRVLADKADTIRIIRELRLVAPPQYHRRP